MRTTMTPFGGSSLLLTNVRRIRFSPFVKHGFFQPGPVHLNHFRSRTIGNGGSSWWHFVLRPFTGLIGGFLDDLNDALDYFVSLPKTKETKPAHSFDDSLRIVDITADVRFRGN